MAGTHLHEWHSQELMSDWFSKASELTEATMKAAAHVQLASLDRLMEGLVGWRSIFANSHRQNEQNHHGKHSIAQNYHRLWQQGLGWVEPAKNASKKKSSQQNKINQQSKTSQQSKINQQSKTNQQSKAKKSSRSHVKSKQKGRSAQQ